MWKTMCEGKPTLKGAIGWRLPKGNQKYKTRILPEHSITSFLCKRLWCSTLMMRGGFSCLSSLQLLAQVVLHGSSFTSGLRWSTLLRLGQINQNNIIFPLVADNTSVAYCFLSYPLVLSLYTSASSSPVVYFNVVWTEQLVVTWGWLCCSHSDIFKGGQGRHHCCLWSVGDSPACCTSSTLASSWCEGSRVCLRGRVQDMAGFDRDGFFQCVCARQKSSSIKVYYNLKPRLIELFKGEQHFRDRWPTIPVKWKEYSIFLLFDKDLYSQ